MRFPSTTWDYSDGLWSIWYVALCLRGLANGFKASSCRGVSKSVAMSLLTRKSAIVFVSLFPDHRQDDAVCSLPRVQDLDRQRIQRTLSRRPLFRFWTHKMAVHPCQRVTGSHEADQVHRRAQSSEAIRIRKSVEETLSSFWNLPTSPATRWE